MGKYTGRAKTRDKKRKRNVKSRVQGVRACLSEFHLRVCGGTVGNVVRTRCVARSGADEKERNRGGGMQSSASLVAY